MIGLAIGTGVVFFLLYLGKSKRKKTEELSDSKKVIESDSKKTKAFSLIQKPFVKWVLWIVAIWFLGCWFFDLPSYDPKTLKNKLVEAAENRQKEEQQLSNCERLRRSMLSNGWIIYKEITVTPEKATEWIERPFPRAKKFFLFQDDGWMVEIHPDGKEYNVSGNEIIYPPQVDKWKLRGGIGDKPMKVLFLIHS